MPLSFLRIYMFWGKQSLPLLIQRGSARWSDEKSIFGFSCSVGELRLAELSL
jgi:hypothetical protein